MTGSDMRWFTLGLLVGAVLMLVWRSRERLDTTDARTWRTEYYKRPKGKSA